MIEDWKEWHRHYDDENSPLSHRLALTQQEFLKALMRAPSGPSDVVQVVSICAGEGRDVLPILAAGKHGRRVKTLLLELDQKIADKARKYIDEQGLLDTEVRVADAGTIDSFIDALPIDILIASGVFGNISADDMERTVAALPNILNLNGYLVWTRSRRLCGHDKSLDIREALIENGFSEVTFELIPEGTFRVGVHQFTDNITKRSVTLNERRLFCFNNKQSNNS